MPKTIEDFLDWKVANEYTIENHRFIRVLRKIFGSWGHLYESFTAEIPKVQRLRADLVASLNADPEPRPAIARIWVMFIKPRIHVLEFWSGMFAVFAAIYTIVVTLFNVLTNALHLLPPTALLLSIIAIVILCLSLKFYVDRRIFWYKFIVSHLEAIADEPNLSFKRDHRQAALVVTLHGPLTQTLGQIK